MSILSPRLSTSTDHSSSTSPHAYTPFIRKRQLRTLLLASLSRWILTAVLLIAIYVVLQHYSSKEAMTQKKKHEFNALIVALPIALSLNIASALKAIAAELRWWVLSLREWSAGEADLILQSENLSHLIQLMCVTKLFSVRFWISLWLFINIASQAGIATLGLTYSVGNANGVYIRRPGLVSIANLTNIQTNKVISSESQTINALRYTANSYGLAALVYNWASLNDIPKPGSLANGDLPFIFCSKPGTCKFVFYESTPDSFPHEFTVTTNRSVTTEADCLSWQVIEGGDGANSSIIIADGRILELPVTNGDEQTIFMVNRSDIHSTWSLISAFEASQTNAWYYECNITVSPVTNAILPVHHLGTGITALASPAIALQGYGSSTVNATSLATQFQSYPAESTFGTRQGGSETGMNLLVASFAIGVIAVTADTNEEIKVQGLLPLDSVNLNVPHWRYVHIILGLIAGTQGLLALGSALVANNVMVRSHSCLGMAWLLRPVVQKMSYRTVGVAGRGKWAVGDGGTMLRYRPVGRGSDVYYVEAR